MYVVLDHNPESTKVTMRLLFRKDRDDDGIILFNGRLNGSKEFNKERIKILNQMVGCYNNFHGWSDGE